MSATSTLSDDRAATLHPLIRTTGSGRRPAWVQVGARRRAHLERVGELMATWARALDRSERDLHRWRAAGLLHDALKDRDAHELRILAGVDWPRPLLHGPAIAGRLRREGVKDDELLLALSHHSVGHPSFRALGECLYLADFLDPGRPFRRRRRAALLERLPEERREVLVETVALKLGHLLSERHTILDVSLRFWNRLVGED